MNPCVQTTDQATYIQAKGPFYARKSHNSCDKATTSDATMSRVTHARAFVDP